MQTALYSFCLRPIHFVSDVSRSIYPRYPLRRNSAGDRQRIDLMGVSPALSALTWKYHYPHTFHRRLWLLSKGLNVMVIARFLRSSRMVHLAAEISYRPCDQRTCRVDILLSSYLELLFSLHLYRGRSLVFNNRFLLRF